MFLTRMLLTLIEPIVTLACYLAWPFVRAYQLYTALRDIVENVAQASAGNVIPAQAKRQGVGLVAFSRARTNPKQGGKPLIIISEKILEKLIEAVVRRMIPPELIGELKENARLLKESIRMATTLAEILQKETLEAQEALDAQNRVNVLLKANNDQKLQIVTLQQQLTASGQDQTTLDQIAALQATMETTLLGTDPAATDGAGKGDGSGGAAGGTVGTGTAPA